MPRVPFYDEIEALGLDDLINDYGAEVLYQRDFGGAQVTIRIGGTNVSHHAVEDGAEAMGFQLVQTDADDIEFEDFEDDDN